MEVRLRPSARNVHVFERPRPSDDLSSSKTGVLSTPVLYDCRPKGPGGSCGPESRQSRVLSGTFVLGGLEGLPGPCIDDSGHCQDVCRSADTVSRRVFRTDDGRYTFLSVVCVGSSPWTPQSTRTLLLSPRTLGTEGRCRTTMSHRAVLTQ